MKLAKYEWALIIAFAFYMIFGLSQQAFLRIFAGQEKMMQIHVIAMAGSILGAFLLPLLLPLRELKECRRPSRGLRWEARLVITGALFLPNFVIRLLGPQVWLESSVCSGVMALANGVITTLMVGSVFTLINKNKIFWIALAYGISLSVYHLVLGTLQVSSLFMFAVSGIAMTMGGVFLFLFLLAVPETKKNPPQSANLHNKRFSIPYIFPILAALVIFWTNSFTDQLFLPTLNIHFPPGFYFTSVVLILAPPLLGLIAGFWWQRFLNVFIPMCFFLFLLAPSLLLFSHSHILFLILYTLNVTMIRMIVVIYPFVIAEMYWRNSPNGYWGWLLPVSITLIHINAFIPAGPFKALSLDNAYAVILLSLAAVVFFVFSRKITGSLPKAATPDSIPSNQPPELSREESFKLHELTEREIMAAELILQGLENDKIKEKMFISLPTVKRHVGEILRKYKVKRRTEFIAMFIR